MGNSRVITRCRSNARYYRQVAGRLQIGEKLAEIVLGVGLFAGTGLLLAIVVPLGSSRVFDIACVWPASILPLAFAAVNILAWDSKRAQVNAAPVIQACFRFRSEYGRYPVQLTDLVPHFLPSIPKAKNSLVGRRFFYDTQEPALCYAVMFHGVLCYDFPSKEWTSND
jgi:hypothetical protein